MLPAAAAENVNEILADAGVPAGAIASGKIFAIYLVASYAHLYWAAAFFVRDL